MLDTIADIRSRMGTCNQRDADTATLLGIVDSLLANEARMRAVLEGILGIINKTHGVDGWNLNGEIATWEQLGYPEEIESVLSVPPGPVSELIEAVGELKKHRFVINDPRNDLTVYAVMPPAMDAVLKAYAKVVGK